MSGDRFGGRNALFINSFKVSVTRPFGVCSPLGTRLIKRAAAARRRSGFCSAGCSAAARSGARAITSTRLPKDALHNDSPFPWSRRCRLAQPPSSAPPRARGEPLLGRGVQLAACQRRWSPDLFDEAALARRQRARRLLRLTTRSLLAVGAAGGPWCVPCGAGGRRSCSAGRLIDQTDRCQ